MENYILASCTDVGKARSVNEDSMVTFSTPNNGRVLVVCDGMGGQNAGDVASKIAITVVQDILTSNAFPTPEDAIKSSIMAANKAILFKASKDPSLIGMGSTCVMAIIKDGKLYYGSVGDSRIYYVANGMIRQITKDQSVVQTLVDDGTITQDEAEHHPQKNEITNALGIDKMAPPTVSQVPITPEPGSICLLCSDGLSGMINNNAIVSTLMRSDKSLQERAELLVNQANEAGGNDNITVQLVEWPAAGQSGVARGKKSPAPRKNNTWIFIVLSIVLVLAGGAFGTWWFLHKDEPTQVITSHDNTFQKKDSSRTVKRQTETVVKKSEVKVIKETPAKKISAPKSKIKNVIDKAKDKKPNSTAKSLKDIEKITNPGANETPKEVLKKNFQNEKEAE